MSGDATSLKIIAQPNPYHRERYGSETCHGRQRSYRFIRSTLASKEFEYPTIEIPSTWIGRSVYICATLVTVVTPEQSKRCVHPYPIDTTERSVIRDSLRNALYFPVTANDFERRVKSFRISMVKLVQQDLRKRIPLRLFNIEKNDDRLIYDARQCIEAYQLDKSQLAFSVAECIDVMESDQTPLSREIEENQSDDTKEKKRQIIYAATTVFSDIFSARKPTQSLNERHAQCAPFYGDFQGDEPILLYVPDLDRRKTCRLSFFYPEMKLMRDIAIKFIDTKTISFRTPRYPSEVFPSQPVSVNIIVHQNDRDIARINFLFRPTNLCRQCSIEELPEED